MINYVHTVIKEFPEKITGSAATPTAKHLFMMREPENSKPLPEEQAQQLHRVVAQLLFISARVRRDIQTVATFLTTRVQTPYVDDWGKLKRVLKYLNSTKYMNLKLTVEYMMAINWFMDAPGNTYMITKVIQEQ